MKNKEIQSEKNISEEKKVEVKSTKKSKIIKITILVIIFVGFLAGLTKAGFIENYSDLEILCSGNKEETINIGNKYGKVQNLPVDLKPVIYLYPQKKQKIKVQLDYKGKIIADYPEYDEKIKGWEVEAFSDSRVIDLRDGEEYSYLFWEGIPNKKIDWNLDEGFIVEGKNARIFLKEKLKYLGLTPKEYNEFIVYWYPKMMNNKYNLVHFATKKYTESATLKILPKPNSMLRVFMVMKKLDKKIEIKTQKLEKFERRGFAVVEWGGTEIE